MLPSSSAASAVIFISVGLWRMGGDQVLEWAVIPIHWANLISPTVPSYYTLHPPRTQALAGGEEDEGRQRLKQGNARREVWRRRGGSRRKELPREEIDYEQPERDGRGGGPRKCQALKKCQR